MPETVTEQLKLRSYQEAMVEHIMANPRCALFCSMGAGKTISTLTALDRLAIFEDVFPALILAPLRVARSTWPDEVKKWGMVKHLKIVPVCGTEKQRREALDTEAQIYTVNYEMLPWLVELFREAWPFKTVVADELSRLKSFRLRGGSKRAAALAKVAHSRVKRFIGLTGTPAPQGLQDLWGPLWFLDRGARLGQTYSAFTERWFRVNYNGFGLAPMPHAQKEIEEKIKGVCLTIDVKDYMNISEPWVNKIFVDLPPNVRKIYKDLETKFFHDLGDEKVIEAFNAGAKMQKCMAVASGFYYSDSEDHVKFEVLHDEKIKVVESIVEESAGAPLLVSYNFRSDLIRLKKAFPQGRELNKDPQTLVDWNAGRIPLLFAHPQSAGHGLNLATPSATIVFFGINFNLENHLQIIERIGCVRQAQLGLNRPVFIHYILARNTLDEVVLKRLETKQSVQDILLDALKRRSDDQ